MIKKSRLQDNDLRLPVGGFTPKIAGRPSNEVHAVPLPHSLCVGLERQGERYTPSVKQGQVVTLGDSLGELRTEHGLLNIPAPASGKVVVDDATPECLWLEEIDEDPAESVYETYKPQYITSLQMREALSRAGIWPFFRNTATGGMSTLSGSEAPGVIIANFVLAEPFRARGHIILQRSWDHIIAGLRFLPRLMADYGKVEVVLTAVHHPVAKKMYQELSGFAWARLHPVPVTYPIENPRVLIEVLRKQLSFDEGNDRVWVIDAQGIAAIGESLTEGRPAVNRIVTVGGPGCSNPEHKSVRVGTPLVDCLSPDFDPQKGKVLRGGVMNGTVVDPASEGVQYNDDSFFMLPEVTEREFLGFVRPGFRRTSYSRAFMSKITGAKDSQITTSLRGERRPCISCGLCEQICPAGLLPQILHRYLYRDMLDEAGKFGLERCVDCKLCTFVCPSKIELHVQFAEAKEQLRQEQADMVAVAEKSDQ